jgi:hypothetical protein
MRVAAIARIVTTAAVMSAVTLAPAVARARAAAAELPANESKPAAPEPSFTDADRARFYAGIDALAAGDLERARSVFAELATRGETAAARASARLIAERLPPPSAATADASSFRAPVLATTTALGLALWGWTLPTALDLNSSDSTRAFLGVYMLTAAASFAVPYFITRDHPPDASAMNAIFYGGTRGAAFGYLLSNLVFGRAGGEPDEHERAFAASLLIGSLGGAVAGSLLPGRLALAPGDVRTTAALSDYGLFAGLALSHVLGFETSGNDGDPAALDRRARARSGLSLGGALLGLGGGHLLARHRQNTWGDGEVMRGAGLLGVLAGATAAALGNQKDDSRWVLGLMAAGGGVGLVGGDWFVRDTAYSPGQGLLVDLALVSGGLGAAGLTYLIANSSEPKAYLVAATLGATACGGGVAVALDRRGGGQPKASARGRGATAPMAVVPQFGAGGPNGLAVVGAF